MPSRISKPKAKAQKKPVERWNEQHRLISHLLEHELSGLLQYLRSLQYVTMFIIAAAALVLVMALQALFENGQHAVTSYLVLIGASSLSIILGLLALRPWVLPRFLLPIDIRQLRYDEMMDVVAQPREYIHLLKQHIEHLTQTYLLRKLTHIRRGIAIQVFGLAVAVVLSIALP